MTIYGFPVELGTEEAGRPFDETLATGIPRTKMAEQRARGQTAAKVCIVQAGLGGHTMQHKRYHTGTHLFKVPREILGQNFASTATTSPKNACDLTSTSTAK